MESLEALRSYVQLLRERDGIREIRLSHAARQGLAMLADCHAVSLRRAPAGPVNPQRVGEASLPGVAMTRPSASGTVVALVGRPASTNLLGELRPAIVVRTEPDMVTAQAPVVEGTSKIEQLRHLAERAAVCVKCPHLAARRHTVVFGVGDPDARIMFVGEAPGEEEDLQGEPFVGRAGQLLTKMITAMDLTREKVYIANIVKCRPDTPLGSTGNRKPSRAEMDTCLPYLRAQIDVVKPEVMIAMGSTALEGLLGQVGSITRMRGTFLEYRGIPLMPTFHPSYLLRNQNNAEKRKVWEDLLQVMERVQMPINDRQRGYFLSK